MFQPSPQRLFRSISSLAHFKIHHQLPLNPRESRQLLNLLTSSFRQQLDQEHGNIVLDPDVGTWAKSPTSCPAPSKRRRASTPGRSDRSRIDLHLHSILSNPLFNYGPEKTSKEDGQRDPMDIFDEACAKGFMKMEYAAACLKAKKRLITHSSILSVRDGMKASGAGLKVLRWLSSCGMIKDTMFAENHEFTTLLIEFLVASELHEVVWSWTEKAMRQITVVGTNRRGQPAAELSTQLLMSLIKAQALLDPINLDAAYVSLVRAKKTLDERQCPTRSILSRPGCFLSYQSSINASLHLPPSAINYDLFLQLVPAFTRREALHMAHLRLHHPTKPDALPALKYLRGIKHGNWKSALLEKSRDVSDVRQGKDGWRMIAIGLDTAKFLLERDDYADARWVMDFLQATYPHELGLSSRQKHDFEQAKAEAASLELLQSLNLA
ncbi:MAG: hypothetical protein M1818_005219 [Claussenomyces sp. TS43310]|nr:MAG: hypothetical protein M1818_005219 [Claussenomyces sp. TS43310]